MSAGFEPARAEPNGLAVHLLNHSDMTSYIIIKKIGPTEIRTRDVAFKVLSANHYTMGPFFLFQDTLGCFIHKR